MGRRVIDRGLLEAWSDPLLSAWDVLSLGNRFLDQPRPSRFWIAGGLIVFLTRWLPPSNSECSSRAIYCPRHHLVSICRTVTDKQTNNASLKTRTL